MSSPTKPTNNTAYADVLTELKELLPKSYIGGLITSNDAGDTDHDVNITAGEARDTTDVESLRLAAEITKQIDVAWAVGDDDGGIDAGAVAADTLYAVWLIKRSNTGVVDALFSTSFTSPTLPADYDYKRLIGAVMTDGAANIIAFTQVDNYFRYTGDVLSDIADAVMVDDVFKNAALSVPPSCMAHVYGSLANPTTTSKVTGSLYIRTKGAADAAAAAERWSQLHADALFDETGCVGQVLVDSDSEVEYAASEVDGAATVSISTLGFWMLTRREP